MKLLSLGFALILTLPSAMAVLPSGIVQPKAVFASDSGETITILERKGEWFNARYEANDGNVVREMSGTVKDNQIFWLGKDVYVVRGYGSGDCYGTFDGNKFYLNSYNPDGTWHSTYHLAQYGAGPDAEEPAGVPWIAVFSSEFPKMSGWATLPLANSVPGSIRDEIATLEEGLKDEAAAAPQSNAQAYADADQICKVLLVALDDRENTLRQNRQNAAGKLSDAWVNAWETRTARYRGTVRTSFTQFAAAVRQSSKPAQPVPVNLSASINLPPVPASIEGSTNDFKPDAHNPLNRGAYDRHPIWAPWWGYHTRYYY